MQINMATLYTEWSLVQTDLCYVHTCNYVILCASLNCQKQMCVCARLQRHWRLNRDLQTNKLYILRAQLLHNT